MLPGFIPCIPGRPPVNIEYIGGSTITWTASILSGTINFDLGREDPNRHIFVCFTSNMDSAPVSGTLEGEDLIEEVNERDSGDNLSAIIYSVFKPTGTTGQSLVITKNNIASVSGRVDLFRGNYVTNPNADFDSGTIDAPVDTLSWTGLNVPLGGAVIACAASDGAGITVTWTGLTEYSDVTLGSCNMSVAALNVPAGDASFSASVEQLFATGLVGAILAIG